MKWNKIDCYPIFIESRDFLLKKLGISQLDFSRRDVLIPYFTAILKYLNKRLILLGTDDIKVIVQEIFDIFDHGAELICNKHTLDLTVEVGIPTNTTDTDTDDNLKYDQDRFVFSWTNFMTSLCMRLKFQYAYLFTQDYDGDCCKCGAKGQTWKDYESWMSGVYPEDEEYDRCNYTRTNSAWSTSHSSYCECQREN